MLQYQILDLMDKMNSLDFYLKNNNKCTVKSIERNLILKNLELIQNNIDIEVTKLNERIYKVEHLIKGVKGAELKFKKNITVHMVVSYKIGDIIDSIKNIKGSEIKIPQYVANYFENA